MNLQRLTGELPERPETNIAPPPPQNLLRFSNGEYHRTAIRHRCAATTVLLFLKPDLSKPEASATFRDQVDAHSWAQTIAQQNPGVTVALLNRFGECVLMLNTPPNLPSKHWSWVESLWRGAAPIPRGKTKPAQSEFDLGLPAGEKAGPAASDGKEFGEPPF
jgi:hypothetical protein